MSPLLFVCPPFISIHFRTPPKINVVSRIIIRFSWFGKKSNAFFAARRRSKKTADKIANSGTNAVIAASVLTTENGSIYQRFGRPTARANRLPSSSPRNTVVAARPSTAICVRCASGTLPATRKGQHHHGYHLFRARFWRDGAGGRISQQVLSVREVKHETNALYAEVPNALWEKSIAIQSIVCDGRKGLL